MPGTYQPDGKIVRINSFAQTMQVIVSKQRPRKVSMYGDDGVEYVFLLKGREDLRQDERVMQATPLAIRCRRSRRHHFFCCRRLRRVDFLG